MDNILRTAVDAALPWYVKHWRLIGVVAAAILISSYIALLHHRLEERAEMLKVANAELIKVTAQYQADVAHLKTAIYNQNAAITEAEAHTKHAKATAVYANSKAINTRTATDHQVNQILSQPKPTNAEAAISSLVIGVSYLQWDQIK